MAELKALDSRDEYAVGLITALPIERAAVTAMLDERHKRPHDFEQLRTDSNSYTWGRMGKHNVVIASLAAGVYGNTNATATALGMLSSFPRIRFGLLIGIGAGVPSDRRDIRLGDVAVSQPKGSNGGVVQYDLGKAKSGGKLDRGDFLARPPDVLLKALGSLEAEHELMASCITDFLRAAVDRNPKFKRAALYPGFEQDQLFQPEYEHVRHEADDCRKCDSANIVKRPERESYEPMVHYGVIASGNTLIKNVPVRKNVQEKMAHML